MKQTKGSYETKSRWKNAKISCLRIRMHMCNWKQWKIKAQLWAISKKFANSNSCEQAWANNLKDLSNLKDIEKKHNNEQL